MPFRCFTVEQLDSLLKSHPISEEGRRFIELALAAPSRNVQGSTRNLVSDLPCPKMGANAQSESATDENPFTLKHVFDEEIIGYTNQAPALELIYKGRNEKTVRAPYRGDCLLFHRRHGVVLEEYKPASDRGLLEEKYPGKYQRLASGDYTSLPICKVVNPWGIKFVVRFSDEISTIAHRNRRFLYVYLHPGAVTHYASIFPSVQTLLCETNCLSYADMIDSGADADALNWAIATGLLHIDYDSALITTEKSKILVFAHAESLKAWQLAIRPDGSRPDLKILSPVQDLRPGDVFVFDGRRLTVSINGTTAIHATDERQQYVTIEFGTLAQALRHGKLVLPISSATETEVRSRFWSSTSATLIRAIRRFGILEKLAQRAAIPLEDQHSASTYRRWQRAIRDGEANGLSPVECLLDFGDEQGFRGSHIELTFSADLNAWIEEALKDQKDKSINAIYYDLKKVAEALGRTMIAKSSFYERVARIESVDTVRDSRGHKVAYQLTPSYWMLDLETPVHCEHALELVHFDSTLLDVEVRSSLSGDVLGRPWLSIAICAYSRRVVGMYLSFKPPGYVSSMMLLADIVRRFGRLPDAIIHDWGSEFKAKDWKYALTALFIARHTRPKSAPRFGAILERMFGIVTRELIDNIAGNTKLRKNVRQLTPSSDPTTHSGLWLSDLYQGLEEYFFSIYDSRKHPATLQPPRARYDASFISHGAKLHRMKRYEDILPVLMPTAKGRPRVIDSVRGIYVNYHYYGHPLLTGLNMSGTTTLVKSMPFDPGSVLAFLKGNWVVCKSSLYDEMQRAPEFIRRCFFEEWNVEQILVSKSHGDSRMKLRKLIDELNQKALDNKEYWRERENKEVLSVASFSTIAAAPAESTALAKLNEMMKNALATAMRSDDVGSLVGD